MRARGWRALLLAFAGVLGVAVLLPASAPARGNPCAEFFEASLSSAPTAEASPLDPAVTGMFAVLRRAAGPEDQIPIFNTLSEDIGYQLRSYLPAYIRQLMRDSEGDRYFVIVGFARSDFPPPQCLPPSVRRMHARLVEEQRKREQTPLYCIEDVASRRLGYGQSGCQPFAAVQTGARLVELDDSNSDVVELVPDGVATVRLDYLERNVVTATVTSNAFSFTPPQRLVKDVQRRLRPLRRELIQELRKQRHHLHATPVRRGIVRLERAIRDELRPRSVEWIGANGQIVRSFQPKGESSGGGALSNIITIS